MYSETKKYFRYLNLVREDIREEFDLLGIPDTVSRICDFGCGNGITTFSLALEVEGSKCIGIDLFENKASPEKLNQYIEIVKTKCENMQSPKASFSTDLCKLILENRSPQFNRGNIVLNQNLPGNIHLAYCKKVLINILDKKYENIPSGEKGLLDGLKHINRSIKSDGWLCVIEYDREFKLESYLEMSGLRILKRAQIERREIRSRGRTNAISTFTLYLGRKS